MTIYRFERVAVTNVELTYVSSSDPDTIGIEFSLEGNALFEMQAGEDRAVSVVFDEIENAEIPLSDLRALLERGEKELMDWYRRLEWPKD